MILADVFYPGWKLQIDGAEAPVVQANGMMRGGRRGSGISPAGLLLRAGIVPIGPGRFRRDADHRDGCQCLGPAQARSTRHGRMSWTFFYERVKKLSQNGCREGDSPILLRRLRKIGTVPGRFEIVPKAMDIVRSAGNGWRCSACPFYSSIRFFHNL